MTAAPRKANDAIIFRAFVADGKPGAASRVGKTFQISRQRVDQIVKRHSATNRAIPTVGVSQVLSSVSVPQDVSYEVTAPIPAVDVSADDLAYTPPPNAYAPAEPRIDLCVNLRDMSHVTFHEPVFDMPQTDLLADLIMSNEPQMQVAEEPILQVPEFAYSINRPAIYLQVADARPRRQLRPGEMHLILCACMTIITIAAGTQALGLGMALWIVMMVMWATPV